MKADTREPGKWLGDVKNMYFSIEIFRVLISKCTKMDNSRPLCLVFFFKSSCLYLKCEQIEI